VSVVESIKKGFVKKMYGGEYMRLTKRARKAFREGWWEGAGMAMWLLLPLYLVIGFGALLLIWLR
jgi:hypothetical protein